MVVVGLALADVVAFVVDVGGVAFVVGVGVVILSTSGRCRCPDC